VIYRFGTFALDTELLELRSARSRDRGLQVFGVLTQLIENRSRVVSKDELINAVCNGRIVSDATLNSRINAARRAVGDTGTAQAIIRTIVKRGFRFIAEWRVCVPACGRCAVGRRLARKRRTRCLLAPPKGSTISS